MADTLDDAKLRAVYAWVDKIPLTRPKRNITRDFSDGVMLAEVVAAYFPLLVELHNYGPANSVKQKIYNFETLNNRVLKKLGFQMTRKQMDDMVNCVPGVAEMILHSLQQKMTKYDEEKNKKRSASTPRGGGSASSAASRGGTTIGETKSTPPAAVEPSRGIPKSSVGMSKKSEMTTVYAAVDSEILREKEELIRSLQEQVTILELKVAKLEQLVRFKDNKIAKLVNP
jgi:hypothetical protein